MLAALAVVTESMPTISPSTIAAPSALNLMLPLQPAHAGLRVDLGAVIDGVREVVHEQRVPGAAVAPLTHSPQSVQAGCRTPIWLARS
jgi:hypothetical protein